MNLKWNRSKILILFWIVFFLIDSLKKIDSITSDGEVFWFYHLPGYVLWVILSFIISKAFNWANTFVPWKKFALLFASGIVIGAVKVILSWDSFYLGFFLIKDEALGDGHIQFLLSIRLFYFVEATIIVWVAIAVIYIFDLNRQYQKQSIDLSITETQLAKAQLQSLKMQLRPHFLFNANNTISMLIRKGNNDKAVEMIAGLSDLLRSSLLMESHQFVTLKEELDLLNKYLKIETIRFEDNLQIKISFPKELESTLIPNFILQPIVENAFKHGFSKTLNTFILDIMVRKEKQQLAIEIFNTGPKFEGGKTNNQGIGLDNTIRRLSKLFNENYKFQIINKNNGVLVTIKIPLNYNRNTINNAG